MRRQQGATESSSTAPQCLILFVLAAFAFASFVSVVQYGAHGPSSVAPAYVGNNTRASEICTKPLKVAYFNGTTAVPDYILANTSATLTNSITISFWMYPTRVGNGVPSPFYSEDIMDLDNKTAELPQIYIEWRGNGRLNLNVCNTCVGNATVEPHIVKETSNPNVGSEAWINLNLSNRWMYVAITYNRGNYSFYIDGNSTEVFGGPAASYTNIRDALVYLSTPIPYSQQAVDTVFGGYLADVRLYDVSLHSLDVMALYNAGIDAPPKNSGGLLAWWPLNGNARDYSGNGYDGIVYGNVGFVPLSSLGC